VVWTRSPAGVTIPTSTVEVDQDNGHNGLEGWNVRLVAAAALAWLVASGAGAGCVDIDTDDIERLREIAPSDETRARAMVSGRPWPAVASSTAIDGISRGRIRDILAEGVACVGRRAEPGERPRLQGIASVLDADTLVVAEVRVRLIGIDAPEDDQTCLVDDHEWPCGQVATAAVDDLVGVEPVHCEVYGHDRWGRALAVCYQGGLDLNAAIVRSGWALAWYPGTGAVLGPSYEAAEEEARLKTAGVWQGSFTEPWRWRRRTN